MTDLTAKFTALEDQMATQHSAISAKLDTIIAALGDINTTLTNNGAFDTTPIVDAINNLRGVGPENTLRSVNQSIWNLAGTAPGRSLSDLYDTLTYQEGNVLWTTAGAIHGVKLALHNADQTLDAVDLLTEINDNLVAALIKPEIVRLLAQFDSSVVYPTMKDLLLTISAQQAQQLALTANPLTTVPAGICETPFVSTGSTYVDASLVSTTPWTIATWPAAPAGSDLTVSSDLTEGDIIVHSDDWSQYRIYVAATAQHFGVVRTSSQRFRTNEWVVLSGNEDFRFYVERSDDLRVYICGQGDPILGGCPTAAEDPLIPSGWRIPVAEDLFWEMASGYNNGGITWTLDINVPHAQGTGIGDTAERPAFIIVRDSGSPAELCVAWAGARDGEGIQIHRWIELSPGNWTSGGAYTARINGVDPATGSKNIILPYTSANNAYTVMAVYPPDEFQPTPPAATVNISYLPSGWSGS